MKVRRGIIFDILSKYYPKGIQMNSLNILDFGSGSGYLVGEFQKSGISAYGVDISLEAVEFGRSVGVKNLSVFKDKLQFGDGVFDCVLIMDVLEHVSEEKLILDELIRVLKPGGICIVTAPAYKFLWGQQDEISHHYRRYTLQSISKVLSQYKSLKTIKRSYFNTFLFFPIAMVRIFSKLFSLKRRQSDFDLNTKFLNFIFYVIFSVERFFFRFMSFPFGVSVLLINKKNN